MHVLVLGAGYAGLTVGRRARVRGHSVTLTTRNPDRAAALAAEGFQVVHAAEITASQLRAHAGALPDTHVVVTFPPDTTADQSLAEWAKHAKRVTRISSTSVYGAREGLIDADTPIATDERARAQLLSENAWLPNATVLRCAAIYGRDRGVHVRILAGTWQIPGDGSRYVSRIHVNDLATMVLDLHSPGHALLAADAAPATHMETAEFVCARTGVPLPAQVPLESVHVTLRGNRRVDASLTHRALTTALRYPTIREGLAFLGLHSVAPAADAT
jgi:nucleoside-diphosphate-sugar epimerase